MVNCYQKWRNQFHVYDQAVDAVSCWESALKHLYSDLFNQYHFERFPTLPREDDSDLTPDFTVFFNDEYGVIGEVKRTFPDDEVAFNSTLNQIASYDDDHSLKTADGSREVPENCDIFLIISGSSAPQIGTRIASKLEENLFTFDSNLVLLRYQYNTDATLSRYEFQRVTQLEDGFSDAPLPDDISLSNRIGEEGSYGTMEVYPKHFTSVKAKKPLCNDHPPEPYLATILWHKVFPQYLDRDEYRQWQGGSAQKTMPFTRSVDEFHEKLNDYMHEGMANRGWVADTLDFLCDANLAEDIGNGRYEIQFRDLVRDVGEQDIQEGTQMLQQSRELAYMLVNRYCEYTEDSEPDTDEEEAAQSSLVEFSDDE